MTGDEFVAWLEAFYGEHGFLPNEDPALLNKGFTPEQAMGEHLYALQWSQEQGHPVSDADFTREYQRRYEPWVLRTPSQPAATTTAATTTSRYRPLAPTRRTRFLQDYAPQAFYRSY